MTDQTPIEALEALQKELEAQKLLNDRWASASTRAATMIKQLLLERKELDQKFAECERITKDLFDRLEAAEAERDALRKAQTEVQHAILNFFAPWGAWKTVWWEHLVGDTKLFTADNLLRKIQQILPSPKGPAQ